MFSTVWRGRANAKNTLGNCIRGPNRSVGSCIGSRERPGHGWRGGVGRPNGRFGDHGVGWVTVNSVR